MDGLNNDQMAGAAGGISGFADAFLGSIKTQREEEAAKNKFAASMELQRELKSVTGQELFDYGVTMGIPPAQLEPLNLEKKYNISLGKAWVDNLNAQKNTAAKEAGLNLRAEKAAKAKAVGNTGKGANLAFKPEVASAKALNDALVSAGYPIGTKLTAIKDKAKLDAINTAYMDNMGGSIQAAGQQDFLEATSPFATTDVPTFWGMSSKPGVTAQSGYRVKKAQGVIEPPPIGGQAGAPVVAPAPTAVVTPESVGADREKLKASFRRQKI